MKDSRIPKALKDSPEATFQALEREYGHRKLVLEDTRAFYVHDLNGDQKYAEPKKRKRYTSKKRGRR